MSGGYDVNAEQLRAHAANVAAIEARLAPVKAASAYIAQDGLAYGLLCGWISEVLEGRHTKQDELIASVEENLSLVGEALRASADEYEAIEDANARLMDSADGELAR